MLIGDYLSRSAQEFPEKVALVSGERRLQYRDLAGASGALASFLRDKGLATGDRVVIFNDNSPETVIAIFGVLTAGGCMVNVNPLTPPESFGYILNHSGAKFCIASALKQAVLQQAISLCRRPVHQILVAGGVSGEGISDFGEICARRAGTPAQDLRREDLAAIIYTSGSTGKPKGATLTHGNIDMVTSSVTGYLGHTSDDVILQFLPLSIGYGLLQLLVTFKNGGTLVLEKGFGYPYEIIRKLKEERVTGFAGVPTVYSILTHFKELEKEKFPSLRYITNAAAAMPPSFIPRLQEIFPTTKIFLMHGLTECLRTTFLPPEEINRRPTSVGKGMEGVELWLEDPEGKRLGAGETGELVVRGANLMKGYWNDPELTSKVLRRSANAPDKVLYSGDLFRTDEDGFFYFVARTDEVIKSRGMKISPLEVENVIYLLDQVLEVRVIGMLDERLGQAVKAEIVLKKGSGLTEFDVKAHCRERLEEYKIPQNVEFVAALPKSAGGKIKRLA